MNKRKDRAIETVKTYHDQFKECFILVQIVYDGTVIESMHIDTVHQYVENVVIIALWYIEDAGYAEYGNWSIYPAVRYKTCWGCVKNPNQRQK